MARNPDEQKPDDTGCLGPGAGGVGFILLIALAAGGGGGPFVIAAFAWIGVCLGYAVWKSRQ